jgi:hypothetical protein
MRGVVECTLGGRGGITLFTVTSFFAGLGSKAPRRPPRLPRAEKGGCWNVSETGVSGGPESRRSNTAKGTQDASSPSTCAKTRGVNGIPTY